MLTLDLTDDEVKALFVALTTSGSLCRSLGRPDGMVVAMAPGPEQAAALAAYAPVMDALALKVRKLADPSYDPTAPCPDCGVVHSTTGPGGIDDMGLTKEPTEELKLPDNVIRFPGPKTKQ